MASNEKPVEDQINPDKDLIYTYNRELFYHFDKDKGFTQVHDFQNPNNQIIIKQGWDVAEQRLDEIKQKVISGKLSPVAFHMERILMEVPMLAAYMEMSKWRVRRHLKPGVFKKLKPEVLKKYASVFDISVEQLTEPDFLK